ncbi:lysophospholipid acyltransferase family protein [Actinobaculum suis]|uniref:lysophospholipid acyltransferase family protein n=1 Tax=Actinobaculum suis TaxID=1657 RepID=UPI00066FCF07|nr:lysophospholipid acyltransferase family protein [Actinobaculum suis]
MEELEPIDPYLDDGKAKRRHRVRKFLTKPVLNTVLKSTVLGEENIEDLDGAFVLVPNHSSHLDAPMIFSLLPEKLTERLATGAAADYFYRNPGISGLTSLFFNTYPIERKKNTPSKHGRGLKPGRAKGMTGRLLRAGVPILIFPEGTRSRTGELGTPKAGAAALAQRFEVPIVPIAMAGGHEAMPVGAVLPKPRSEVFLFIGKPMYGQEGEDADSYMKRVFRAIELMLEQKTAHPVETDGTSAFDPK